MLNEHGVDFALIGHQETWEQLKSALTVLRDPARPPLSMATVRDTAPWIPPRVLVRTRVTGLSGRTVRGVYIESFITPDELAGRTRARLLAKVQGAVACAEREGARVASLGGFTSIVLEGSFDRVQTNRTLALTTGNTLAAAFVVKGVERAAERIKLDLASSDLLVIGATGDVGTGCARYLACRVRRLLIAGRNTTRLRRLGDELRRSGTDVVESTDMATMIARADVIIGAAAVPNATFGLTGCRPGVLVCDAGYPKNLVIKGHEGAHVFWGGMGQVTGEWKTENSVLEACYAFPAPRVVHGCMLEGVALAMEGRFESFSRGRGQITTSRIEEMWGMASRCGLVLAPFFDRGGLWPGESSQRVRVNDALARGACP